MESFGPDEVIIGENHKDGKLRILKRGVVEIAKRGTIVNRLSSPGSVLGEIAILLDQSFGATVTTLEDTEVYVIEEGDRFLQENPDFMALVAKLIAKRLRNLTDELVEIREQVEAQREDGNDMEQFDGVLQRLIDHHLDREY